MKPGKDRSNATRAAIAAGYSAKTARAIGCENLTKPYIREAIGARLNSEGITAERVKIAIAEIAFGADVADFQPFLDGDKSLAELREAGKNTQLVKSAKATTRTVKKKKSGQASVTVQRSIEPYNRLDALEKLGRVLALPCELSEQEHHKQMRKLLEAVRHCIHDNPDVLTLAQAAARQGVSVEEVRDDVRKWPDKGARALRILVKLKARLHDRILTGEAPRSRPAVRILELDLKEHQPSSSNRVVLEGSGYRVNVINYADAEGGEITESAVTE